MRLSTVLRFKRFLKKKDFVIQDPKNVAPISLKRLAVNFGFVFAVLSTVLLNIPAPDIRFDLRFYLSPTFRKFVESRGYEGIPFDRAKTRIRVYNVNREIEKEYHEYESTDYTDQS